MNAKVCTKCGETKPLTDYIVDPRYKQEVKSWCKECYRAYRKAWYAENRDRELQKLRAKRAKRKHSLPPP